MEPKVCTIHFHQVLVLESCRLALDRSLGLTFDNRAL
jgi:hypothetical protein